MQKPVKEDASLSKKEGEDNEYLSSEEETESEAEEKQKDKLEQARKKHLKDYKLKHKQMTGGEFHFSGEQTQDGRRQWPKEK